MPTRLLQVLLLATIALLACRPASGDEFASPPGVEEEMWALPFPLPVLAYVVRPLGDGPFPLVVMNHGISLDANQRTMFPAVEYRDAAFWFARRGYFVISPLRYGATSLDDKDRGLFGAVFGHVGSCDNPNFRGPGLAIATLNEWVIENMQKKNRSYPAKPLSWASRAAAGDRLRLQVGTRRRLVRSSPLRRGVAAESMASQTTTVLLTNSLLRLANSAARHAYRCFGYIRRTTAILDRS